MRFQILGPEGQTYELTDVAYFQREYQPRGFVIDANPPHGYEVPVVKATKQSENIASPPKEDAPPVDETGDKAPKKVKP